jgi:hypothetical protein
MSGAVTRINSIMHGTLLGAIVIYSMNPAHCNVGFPHGQTWPSEGKTYLTSFTCNIHGSLFAACMAVCYRADFIKIQHLFSYGWRHLANCPLPLSIPQNQIWPVQEESLVLWHVGWKAELPKARNIHCQATDT